MYVRQHWRRLGLGPGFAEAVDLLAPKIFSQFSHVVLGTESCVNTCDLVPYLPIGNCIAVQLLLNKPNKKLCYREEYSASVVLSWCTFMTFLGRKSVDG